MNEAALYVGMDVHKATVAIAVAEPGRNGEVRFIGNVPNKSATVISVLRKLERKHGAIECAYEAGPCAYTLYRELTGAGLTCIVVAPSKIPTSPGHVKNDYRDALGLARLLRAGDLTAVWVPEPIHEAMRDLVRARLAASFDAKKAKQRLQSYLLVRDRHYDFKMWGTRHREWLSRQLFEHPAQQIAYQGYLNAVEQAEGRRRQLEEQIAALLPSWSLAPVVTALQALRGVAPVIAVSIVAEVGDVSRFESPRKLMAYLGLIPGEHSSGATVRSRGITKQGNGVLRSLLFEAAWAHRFMAKVSVAMKARRPEGHPAERHRHRLEGTAPTLRTLSQAAGQGQEESGRRHSGSSRAIGLRLGDCQNGQRGTASRCRVSITRPTQLTSSLFAGIGQSARARYEREPSSTRLGTTTSVDLRRQIEAALRRMVIVGQPTPV